MIYIKTAPIPQEYYWA